MKKFIIALIAIGAIGVAYWLISPLFINNEVNEELSPELEQAVEDAIEEFKGNLADQLPDETMMEAFKEEMGSLEEGVEVTLVEEMPVTDFPFVLSNGSFIDVAHKGSGEVKAIRTGMGNDETIVRLIDLDVSNGPDLRVLLSKERDIMTSGDLGEYIELGKLKGNRGTQNYFVPSNIIDEFDEYQSVVIYCKPFHVVFNSANLN